MKLGEPDSPTHEGWFWFIPVWVWLEEEEIFVKPKYLLPAFLLDFFALLDKTYGWMLEQLNEDYEYPGLLFKLRKLPEDPKE